MYNGANFFYPASCHQMQHSRVQERKRSLEQLQQQVGRKKRENQELDHQLVEMQVSVSERRGVENLAGQQEGVACLLHLNTENGCLCTPLFFGYFFKESLSQLTFSKGSLAL